MKTKLLISTLLVIIGFTASAQFKKYTFGLKAAPQIAWIKPNIDSYSGNGAKIGFSWGFISEFNFSENHCITTGFNVLFNGGKLKYPAKIDTLTGTFSLSRDYFLKSIEIPLTLKMRTNAIGKMKYFGQIGLGTSFRFGAKKTDEYSLGQTTISVPKTNYDNISFLRESLIVGLGGEYTIDAGTTFSVGVALNNGFTDILTSKNTVTAEKEKATSNFVELSIGVLF